MSALQYHGYVAETHCRSCDTWLTTSDLRTGAHGCDS